MAWFVRASGKMRIRPFACAALACVSFVSMARREEAPEWELRAAPATVVDLHGALGRGRYGVV